MEARNIGGADDEVDDVENIDDAAGDDNNDAAGDAEAAASDDASGDAEAATSDDDCGEEDESKNIKRLLFSFITFYY
jgi:hypothetical protein